MSLGTMKVSKMSDLELVKLFCLPEPPHPRLSRRVTTTVKARVLECVGCRPAGSAELSWEDVGSDKNLFPVDKMAAAAREALAAEGIDEIACCENLPWA